MSQNLKLNFITKSDVSFGSARIRVFNIVKHLKGFFENVEILNDFNKEADIVVFQKTIDYELLFEYRKNKIFTCLDIDDFYPNFIGMVKYVDLVIVSTDYLKKVLSKYNKNIIVVPNSLDMNKNNNQNISIGWYGWSVNSKILNNLNIRDDVTVISDNGDIIYNSESIDTDLQKFDYIIIPQDKTKHTLCKTNCRFLKALYLGIPCIVSDMPEYLKLVEEINYPQEYILKNLDDFKPLIQQLKNNELTLPNIDFDNIRKIILNNYSASNIANIFYHKIIEKYNSRKDLSEKLKTIKLFFYHKHFLKKIFSVKNKVSTEAKPYKVITILGIKINIKLKQTAKN